jgi:hypothetical protein
MTQIVVMPWLSGKKENTTLAIAGITLLGFGLLALGYFAFPRTFSFNGRFGGVWVRNPAYNFGNANFG